jgi:UDP-2,3-diacylglucosamine pyrophosphatase LpxH
LFLAIVGRLVMSTSRRLSSVFESADEIAFDDTSRFILLSDCHRGDNSWADDLAHNQTLYFHALNQYYEQEYTYIEIGDGDEMWENKRFKDIRRAHSNVFWLMSEFYKKDRLHLVWGNHNIIWRKPKNVQKHLYEFENEREGTMEPLFPEIKVHEGLVLRHSNTDRKILIVHGHQGDCMSDRLWWLSRFFVRHVWKPLQIWGIRDPTSPAKNHKKRNEVERRITEWIEADEKRMVVCGHTHRPWFPAVGKPLYFNTGSCVHPRCITGIEINSGAIELVKWWVRPDQTGALHIAKETKAGPTPLRDLS